MSTGNIDEQFINDFIIGNKPGVGPISMATSRANDDELSFQVEESRIICDDL